MNIEGEIKINTKPPWEDIRKYTYEIAKKNHANQKRNSGENYFLGHSEKVADIIVNYFNDDVNLFINSDLEKLTESIAYLHDLIEDTSININEIENKFGYDIAMVVSSLTEDKEKRLILENEIISGNLNKNEMKILMLEDSFKKIERLKNIKNKDYYTAAVLIRIADIIQNIEDFESQNYEQKERNIIKANMIREKYKDESKLTNLLKKRIGEISNLIDKKAA